jgi:hypothetical protein
MTDDTKSCPDPRDPRAVWADILEMVADDDAETGESSEGVKQWSQRLDAQVRSRVAELRRRLTPTDVEIKRNVTIPPQIQAMSRNAVVAQLEILRQAGLVRYAHQELTGLSDYNLQLALVLAMESNRK